MKDLRIHNRVGATLPYLQHMDIVTFIPRFPLSANSWAMEVSNTKQSEFMMADWTPSCMDLGVASHVNLRLGPFNSNLIEKCLLQWAKYRDIKDI